jgi:release factor glutamine methyltransferase
MKQYVDYIISELRGVVADEELHDLAYWIMEAVTGLSRSQIICGCKDTENIPNIEIILEKLRAHEPIQYIFGHTDWMGLDLLVTPDTLIPRPETAELVEWVTASQPHNKALRVLDIGTGSGCIAIALKKRCPQWLVMGVDVSSSALSIACENSTRNGVEVMFSEVDILSQVPDKVDVVVSNPPYICEAEKVEMDARVLDYEPHSALFVPDTDPLLFYRRIASMKIANELYFEINEAYGRDVCEMMEKLGYSNVSLKCDIYGKERMVYGSIEV